MNAAAADRLSAEERRDAIVSAVMPLFASKGFDAVTTREIAEAAGVSEALLYRHFPSKRALYEAMQHTCVMRASADAARLSALPDNTSTLVLAAYLVVRNIQLGLPPNGCDVEVPRLVLRSLLTDGEFARSFISTSAAPWLEKVERCVKAAIEAGDLHNDYEAASLGLWFIHHLAAAVVFFRLPGGPVVDYPGSPHPERLFDESMRFALRGIGLTPEAIGRHYNPQAFALLLGAPS